MQLEHVSCDLCGSSDYTTVYRKPDDWLRRNLFEFPVVKCASCGLVYVNPRPTPHEMAAFYPPGYHDGRNDAESFRRYAAQRPYLASLNDKRVLDIGCARGDFLAYLLDQGERFEAHGTDAFSSGVSDSRIRFTPGDFCANGYPAGHFDLAMAWAVFEHLHRPSAYFQEVSRILKPQGRLVVLVTNADSLYGVVGCLEDIPRHTYHFTKKTLAAYGAKAGLKLIGTTFTDSIFDGRGHGTFRTLAARASGATWEKQMRGKTRRFQRVLMRAGWALDSVLFSVHWELFIQRSGILVATYEKP